MRASAEVIMKYLMAAVLGVSCLAEPAQQLLALNAARPYLEEESAAADGPATLPSNVAVADILRPAVTSMLRYSPTFRRQCGRIGRSAELHVVIQRSVLQGTPADAALTRVTRGASGRLDADVQIGSLPDAVLLIAHEFEHILEQLDEVDLSAMAARSGTGVRADSRFGHFETERAVAAGKRVAEEVSRGGFRR
jgi:hypothetical protein